MGNTLNCKPLEDQQFRPEKRYDYLQEGYGIRAVTECMSVPTGDSLEQVTNCYLEEKTTARLLYVLKGTPYAMGRCMGVLATEEIVSACNDYLYHLCAQIVSAEFDRSVTHKHPILQGAYGYLLRSLVDFIVVEVEKAYDRAVKQQWIPVWFQEEFQGLMDGIYSTDIILRIQRGQLLALNFAMDFIMCQVLSGDILNLLKPWFLKAPEGPIRDKLLNMKMSDFHVSDMCNTFGIYGKATKSGKDAFYLRDFQLQSGRWWQQLHIIVIKIPTQGHMTLSITVPGMVGAVTSLNEHGLAAGVNLVRSEACNFKEFGWSAGLVVQGITQCCKQARQVKNFIQKTHRAVAWLFSCQDSHYGTVIEALPQSWSRVTWPRLHPIKPLRVVRVWARDDTYRDPTWVHQQEVPAHIATAHNPFGPQSMMYENWHMDMQQKDKWSNRYIPPQRETQPGFWVVTNDFIVPEARYTQMGPISAQLQRAAYAPQWRYDYLHRKIRTAYGTWTWPEALQHLQFLHPRLQPQYPQNRDLLEHMKEEEADAVPIEGALTAIDCRKRILWLKSGFWGSPWIRIDLRPFATLRHQST